MTAPVPGRHRGPHQDAARTPVREGNAARAGHPVQAAGGSRTADLTDRVDALEQALAVGGDRLAPELRRQAAAAASAVRDRLARGVDHALVALVGGTGSGKSSLFNAVCGLPFSDVGVRRPTTSEVTACVWGASADPLLEWLGVAERRRFERETALDGDAQADLRGLVLLDVPDHDSVEAAHRDVVDRLLPMVDLVVWVVDPQKYADDALHSGYLRALVGQEAAMVVVLNQVDTVPVAVRERLAADVARLLAEDGLTGVPVLLTSAVDGTGIGDLRATLARVVAGPSIAAVRAEAEVAGGARVLASGLGTGEPHAEDLPTSAAVESLAAAAGLPVVAGAVEQAVRGGARDVPAFGAVQQGTVELTRHRWLADVGAGLPPAWRRSLDDRVPPSDALRRATDDALRSVPVVARRSAGATALNVASAVLAVAAVLLGAVLVAGPRVRPEAVDRVTQLGLTPAIAVALGVVAAVLAIASGVVRRRASRRRGEAVRTTGRAALRAVVEERLGAPTLSLLAEHRDVRALVGTAAGAADAVGGGARAAAVVGPSPAGAHVRASTG